MAFVLPVLYLGSMYGLYQYVKNKVREYETTQEIDVDINIDKTEDVYTAISNNNITGNIIVCCTGDMQSMALLYGVMNVFDSKNINVLFINNERYNKMGEFVENICGQHNINFIQKTINTNNIMHINVENNIENTRRDTINELCTQLGTKNVFEAHTIENQCNNILDNIMRGVTYKQLDTIKPFANMDMGVIINFVYKYNIPYDIVTMDHNLTSAMNIFNEFDTVLSLYYPNWRENVINYAQNVNDRLSQFETNIDNIMNKCTATDRFGSYYRYNIDMTSYDLFSNIVNKIADNNNTERPSRYVKTQWYEGKNNASQPNWFCDGHYVVYLNSDIMTHLDNLRTYLDTVNALDYVDSNTTFFNVNLQDENQYKICPSNDIIDYIGDMIKGIIHIEADDEQFSVIELFH